MMTDQQQVSRDQWQTALYEASYRYSVALKELHETNPRPEHPVLADAIGTLATELWDRSFSTSDIAAGLESAIVRLRSYTTGEDIRS